MHLASLFVVRAERIVDTFRLRLLGAEVGNGNFHTQRHQLFALHDEDVRLGHLSAWQTDSPSRGGHGVPRLHRKNDGHLEPHRRNSQMSKLSSRSGAMFHVSYGGLRTYPGARCRRHPWDCRSRRIRSCRPRFRSHSRSEAKNKLMMMSGMSCVRGRLDTAVHFVGLVPLDLNLHRRVVDVVVMLQLLHDGL